MIGGVILMIGFGGVEGFERRDLSDDRSAEYFGGVELLDVGVGDFLLVGILVENYGTVLGAVVWALVVEFGGIVDGEKDAEQLAVGDLRWIVDDFHGFGVAGIAAADGFVLGGVLRASGIAGGGAGDTFYVLEDGLDAPEAASGQNECVLAFLRGERVVDGGLRD